MPDNVIFTLTRFVTRCKPVTMSDWGQSKWYRLYAKAMVELEHALMMGRIMDARSEILRRLETLRDMPGLHEPERRAIQNALSSLRSLEREEARYADEKHREAAKLALEKLRSVGPAIIRTHADRPNRPNQG
jgi:hypothetical protein